MTAPDDGIMEEDAIVLEVIGGAGAKAPGELDKSIRKLEAIARADIRNIYQDGEMVSPNEWPDDEALAVHSITPMAAGNKVQFLDAVRASEALSRLRGALKTEEEDLHPLDRVFARIPRDELVKILKGLDRLCERDGSGD